MLTAALCLYIFVCVCVFAVSLQSLHQILQFSFKKNTYKAYSAIEGY